MAKDVLVIMSEFDADPSQNSSHFFLSGNIDLCVLCKFFDLMEKQAAEKRQNSKSARKKKYCCEIYL